MAYQIKKNADVVEELELLNADGSLAECIRVQLDGGTVAERISRCYVDLLEAQRNLTGAEPSTETYEKLGKAVIALFQAVFGEADTERILAFYQGNFVEMCQSVIPFITKVLLPKIRRAAKGKKTAAYSSYVRKRRRG